MEVAVLADDLTGACDTGVQFARAGHRTEVGFGLPAQLPASGALAIDTNTRILPSGLAHQRVLTAARAVRSARLVYKKLDSTLRGNIAAELAAALEGSGRTHGVFAPAFPEYGRTTRGGMQFVDDVPVHHTAFAHDPRNPVVECHIPTLLTAGGLTGIAMLTREDLLNPARAEQIIRTHTWTVADIETGSDLDALVRAVPDPGSVLWGGSTGLARALGAAFPAPQTSTPAAEPSARQVLIVVGSVNAVSRVQLAHLLDAGAVSVTLDTTLELDEAVAQTVFEVSEALAGGASVALSSTLPAQSVQDEQAAKIATALAVVVQTLTRTSRVDALVLTGGDTAVHIAEQLGATGLTLEREVEPGIPVGHLIGPLPLPVVTKAGGFGSPHALVHALHALQRPQEVPS